MRQRKSPFQDDNDFIVMWLVGAMFIFFLTIVLVNTFVAAAYTASTWVTKPQIEKAESLGAIERTQLEVVDNYGEQSTFNPQNVGRNE